MDNKKTDTTANDSFWKKFDHWILAIAAIPVIGIILKTFFKEITEKGMKWLQQKIEEVLAKLQPPPQQ